MKSFATAAVSAAIVSVAAGASSFTPTRPPAIPLAVRNPYLSTWLDAAPNGGNGGYLPGEWPVFWTDAITAWTGLIKVDGLQYIWMGAPAVPGALCSQSAFNYTSTRSTFTLQCGPVGVIAEFLSPVTPNDYVRSSLASSYLNVQTYSLDGAAHSVQVYSDVSGEWVSGNRNDVIQWANGVAQQPATRKRAIDEDDVVEKRAAKPFRTFGTQTNFIATKPPPPATKTAAPPVSSYSWTAGSYQTYAPGAKGPALKIPAAKKAPKPGVAYHQFFRQAQSFPDEINDQASWGNFYYATSNVAGLTYEIGQDTTVRSDFTNRGYLNDTVDPYFRAINVAYPVFAYSVNLGNVTKTPVNTLFTMNLLQTPVIEYENGLINKNETLNGLWTEYFYDDLDAVTFFYNDFAKSSKMTTALDKQIQNDAVNAGGQDYATITTLAVRQAFGALQLASNGTGTDFYIFLKEISSDGNIQTVDVIFPLHPILLYLNPTWLKLLLEPIFVNTEAGYWPYAFTIHDLGNHYPVALGNNNGNDEMQPLEECGNMLIMSLAYAQRTQDYAWLASHYDVLRQWTGFLVQEALVPANQISTDDFAGSLVNQTNLAIKGIIGIGAMASIANLTGNTADGINFTRTAIDYITQWQQIGAITTNDPTGFPHTTLNYGANNTYSLLYNLFFDKELNLGLVPKKIYNQQSAFYPTVANQYGVPLDTRHTYTKLDWEMLVAAIAQPSTQQFIYSKLASWIGAGASDTKLTDWYDTINGLSQGFTNRPVVGGLFGQLALKSAPKKPALQNGK